MRRSVLAALLLFAVVAASGCRPVDTIEPTYAVFEKAGFCGWHVIIDQRGVLWKERGCENGRPYARRVRALRPDELARVNAAIAQVPPYRENLTREQFLDVYAAFQTITTMPTHTCGNHQLRSRDSDGSVREFTIEPCPHEE
jgi:hypothetical protein